MIGPHEKGQGQETTIKGIKIPEQISLVKMTVMKSVLQEESLQEGSWLQGQLKEESLPQESSSAAVIVLACLRRELG